jgi:hypothetical protein
MLRVGKAEKEVWAPVITRVKSLQICRMKTGWLALVGIRVKPELFLSVRIRPRSGRTNINLLLQPTHAHSNDTTYSYLLMLWWRITVWLLSRKHLSHLQFHFSCTLWVALLYSVPLPVIAQIYLYFSIPAQVVSNASGRWGKYQGTEGRPRWLNGADSTHQYR